MSKKVSRSTDSFIKNWTAIIAGSLFLASIQSAQAAHDRANFREFKANNPGIDRSTARKMFRDNVHHGNGGGITIGVIGQPNSYPDRQNQQTNRVNHFSTNATFQQVAERTINVNKGLDLNLSSNARNITLGEKLLKNGPVEVTVDGQTKTLSAGALVTAAEYVAVKQVLAGNGQSIKVAADGAANGGSVDLSALTSRNDVLRASDLVVPANVVADGDFSRGSDFRLLGDLSNHGTVHAFDGDGRDRGGAIRADNILNAAGGAITSDVDLTLQADHNLTNNGTITGKSNLVLGAGQISNSGRIESLSGNVTLDGSPDADLTINNSGTIAATQGAINVRTEGYKGAGNTYINGGDFLSNSLNLKAGLGTVEANVGNVSGSVLSNGNAVHFTAATDTLTIGNTDLIDPTFKNTGAILINDNLDVAADLTIIAGTTITGTNGFHITTNNNGASASGFPLNLIAGANITSAGTDSGPLPGTQTATDTTFNGASATGGSIAMNGMTINTNATSGNNNGGNILAAAFSGSAIGSGSINLSAVDAGGAGSGINGNMTILAGTNVNISSIVSDTGTGGGGDISIRSAQPTSSGPVTYLANGQLQGGSPTLQAGTLGNGTITVTGVVSGSDVDLRTNGTYSILTGLIAGASTISLTTGQQLLSTQVDADSFDTPLLILTGLNNAKFGERLFVAPFTNIPFELGTEVDAIQVTAAGTANLRTVNPNLTTILTSHVTNDFFLVNDGGATLIDGDLTNDNGSFAFRGPANGINGSITVDDGVTILANGTSGNTGNITLLIADNADKKAIKALEKAGLPLPTITFGLGSTVQTIATQKDVFFAGRISFFAGLVNTKFKQIFKSPSKNINLNLVGTGTFFVGKGKKPFTTFDAPSPINNFTATNVALFFNNQIGPDRIVLEGDVTLDADPPPPSGPISIPDGVDPTQFPIPMDRPINHATVLNLPNPELAIDGIKQASLTPFVQLVDRSALSNQITNLITTEEKVLDLSSSLQDDSMIVAAAPSAFTKEVAICSDLDYIAALLPGVSSTSGLDNKQGFGVIQHDDNVRLENGCVMFAPSRRTQVETPKGTVVLEKGSLAVIATDGEHLSVFDIHDEQKGSIRIEASGNSIALAPGQHATVTSALVRAFSDINPIEPVQHRYVRGHQLSQDAKLFVSDFSIPSAIFAVGPLSALVQSEHVGAKKLAGRLLKTSAILMQLNSDSSPFEYQVKPRTVALNTIR